MIMASKTNTKPSFKSVACSNNDEEQDINNNTRPPGRVSSRNSDLSSSTTDGEKPSVKKLPPIKAPVGLAKGPDLKNCKSKVGSFNNIQHTPSGSGVTIPSQKLKWNAKSKIGSLENKEHKPGGGKIRVETRKLEWKTTSKVQSLQNVDHKPGGGNVKIFNEAYAERAQSPKTAIENENGTNESTSKSRPSATKARNANEIPDSKSISKNMKGLSLID